MSQNSGLTIRQHERAGIELFIEFAVSEEHTPQVRFSASSSAVSQHTIRGEAVDISSGGMGIQSRHFIPRMCEGVVRVFNWEARPEGPLATGDREVIFEHRVKVRRAYLLDREPTYAIGLAFVDPGPGVDEQISGLLRRLQASGQAQNRQFRKGGVNA